MDISNRNLYKLFKLKTLHNNNKIENYGPPSDVYKKKSKSKKKPKKKKT